MKNFPVAAQAYGVSKVLAHTAATDFAKENQLNFDLIRVLPGYIQGANELYTTAEAMRDPAILGSNEGTMMTALGVTFDRPRLTHQVFLDDVAKAHVLALSRSLRNGENLLVVGNNGDSIPWSDFVPIIQKQFPDAVAKGTITPKSEDENALGKYDVASSENALGFKFAGANEIVKSVVGQYVELAAAA